MEWRDLAAVVGRNAPLLGSLLGGPVGGTIGAVVASALGTGNSADQVSAALTSNPDAMVKLRELETTKATKLQELATQQALAELAAATQNASDVNKTMQAEAVAEHWPTYTWRPAIGFAVALAVVLSVLTVFATYGAAIIWNRSEGLDHLPGVLGAVAGIIAVVSPILGIASWFRGKAQADPAIATVNRG